jgi:hypothetical protein
MVKERTEGNRVGESEETDFGLIVRPPAIERRRDAARHFESEGGETTATTGNIRGMGEPETEEKNSREPGERYWHCVVGWVGNGEEEPMQTRINQPSAFISGICGQKRPQHPRTSHACVIVHGTK